MVVVAASDVGSGLRGSGANSAGVMGRKDSCEIGRRSDEDVVGGERRGD